MLDVINVLHEDQVHQVHFHLNHERDLNNSALSQTA